MARHDDEDQRHRPVVDPQVAQQRPPTAPSTEATDRSISPVMMISVIGSARSARSPMFVHSVKRL